MSDRLLLRKLDASASVGLDLSPGCSTCAEALVEVKKLQAFKDWVHGFLDAQGVPHHPPGTHGAAGCRIGDRMDWLMARLRAAEAAAVT